MVNDLAIEIIKANTSIKFKIKRVLDKYPRQVLRPYLLGIWAKEVFKKGRELKYNEQEIAGWVRAYARERNWSEPQISAALDCQIR